MLSVIKKLFGGIDLTWPKLIISACLAGIFTAVMALIPAVHYTSFNTITVTFEVWILFGIIIIMNSKSNLDSALKCFVFFLVSQPLAYLVQVPFTALGWGLFGYYKFWFIWTLLCFPMGFVGYYMKKGKWWGYLILFPMIAITAHSYTGYLSYFLFYMPYYLLICIFCVSAMILYPLVIFEDKKIRTAGAVIGAVIAIAVTGYGLMHPPVYSTEIMSDDEEHHFDNTYKVSLEDDRYGNVEIIYMDSIEAYMVHADFKKAGKTSLTLESPDGDKKIYDIDIKFDTYEITPRQ
ncbi:MAG: hypothetical protein K6F00_10735 [Lachnospiraceae bacterium]|nr:hypothetical protein [Lachnospiraceae bacterium]